MAKKWRETNEPLDECERGEWKADLKLIIKKQQQQQQQQQT